MQTNKQINITGLQTSNYDIYAKLLQLRRLQTYSPAPVLLQTYSPAPVLLTDYVTTGNGQKMASTTAIRSRTLTSTCQ